MITFGGQRIPSRILFLMLSDTMLIVLSLVLATAIRFHDFRLILHNLFTTQAFLSFALVVLFCGLAMYYFDLYNVQVVARDTELFVRLLQALGTACLGLAIVYYGDPDLSLGRGIAALAAPLILILTMCWRLFLDTTSLRIYRPERVLIVGTGAEGISLVREIIDRRHLHLRVVGFLDEMGENIGKSLVNPGIIGAISEVENLVAQEEIDRVILSLKERRGQTPIRQLLNLKFAGVGVEDAHSVWEQLTGRIRLEHLSPSWLILSDGFRKPAFLFASKRAFDLVLSLFGLILILPVLGLVAVAIWLESGGPVLFVQERTGLKGRPFQMLKFRSMRQNAEENGPAWTTDRDPRITRVGHFIRNFRLDEVPQLFNVLRGEMSLVGPRPERPVFCRMLEEKIPLFAQRHSVRPGITGWAQVMYRYGASVEQAKTKLEYDLFYVKHLSIFLDLAIILETIKVILSGRGAK